jgi:hypothetical protein
MAKNKITTDELAAMIQHGFAEAARKGDVDKGFDGVDDRLDRIEKLLHAAQR